MFLLVVVASKMMACGDWEKRRKCMVCVGACCCVADPGEEEISLLVELLEWRRSCQCCREGYWFLPMG